MSDRAKKAVPEHSIPRNSTRCVSLVVRPILSRAKKKAGRALNSAAMDAEARQTDFCVYLSAILLTGLVLNTVHLRMVVGRSSRGIADGSDHCERRIRRNQGEDKRCKIQRPRALRLNAVRVRRGSRGVQGVTIAFCAGNLFPCGDVTEILYRPDCPRGISNAIRRRS